MRNINHAVVCLGICVLPFVASCGGGGWEASESQLDEADRGTVVAALSAVPTGVTCVQMVLTGTTSSTKSFTVTAGTTPVRLSLGTLPSGTINIVPKAYNVACTSVTSSTAQSWSGPMVSADVTPGLVTEIAVTLRQNLPVSVSVDFVSAAVAISAGAYASYAVLADGTVRAWGNNSYGQLGDGTTTSRATPVSVTGLSNIKSVTAGDRYACALSKTGQASCWGLNDKGQLGNGTTTNSKSPVAVSGSYVYRGLYAGRAHVCGATDVMGSWNSTTYCWGLNDKGQLGNGTTTNSTIPTTSPAVPGEFLSSGCVADTTVSVNGQSLYMAGSNSYGQAGVGTASTAMVVLAPVPFSGFTDNGRTVIAAAASARHACVVEGWNGTVWCAGDNSYGMLGNGTQTSSMVPVSTQSADAVAVVASYGSTCALKSDGSVWCWGEQFGTRDGKFLVPTQVNDLTGVRSIAAGSDHICALKNDGAVWCWGDNYDGQLGSGTTYDRVLPTQVSL